MMESFVQLIMCRSPLVEDASDYVANSYLLHVTRVMFHLATPYTDVLAVTLRNFEKNKRDSLLVQNLIVNTLGHQPSGAADSLSALAAIDCCDNVSTRLCTAATDISPRASAHGAIL